MSDEALPGEFAALNIDTTSLTIECLVVPNDALVLVFVALTSCCSIDVSRDSIEHSNSSHGTSKYFTV